SDFYEAQAGKVEARPSGNSAYVPGAPDEWVFFQELSQMESTFKLKLVSPVDPLPMLLLGGEGSVTVDQGGDGKGFKGGGKGGPTTVSMLDGWVKFRTDPATADQVQKIRGSLQSVFQTFCQNSDHIPPAASLALLDKVAAMLSNPASGSTGMKRPADGSAEGDNRGGPASRLTPKMPAKGGSWGKGGGGGGGGKGGGASWQGGGGGKGGWKGGKGW
ncbi:unnamed protein product, partial [Polarella glacialis]